jgi:hypothetical protein
MERNDITHLSEWSSYPTLTVVRHPRMFLSGVQSLRNFWIPDRSHRRSGIPPKAGHSGMTNS